MVEDTPKPFPTAVGPGKSGGDPRRGPKNSLPRSTGVEKGQGSPVRTQQPYPKRKQTRGSGGREKKRDEPRPRLKPLSLGSSHTATEVRGCVSVRGGERDLRTIRVGRSQKQEHEARDGRGVAEEATRVDREWLRKAGATMEEWHRGMSHHGRARVIRQ